MKNIGDVVTWTSQAGGQSKKKTGKILAIIPKGTIGKDVFESVTKLSWWESNSAIKFGMTNTISDRYLIEVPGGGKSKCVDYYAPHVGVIDKQN